MELSHAIPAKLIIETPAPTTIMCSQTGAQSTHISKNPHVSISDQSHVEAHHISDSGLQGKSSEIETPQLIPKKGGPSWIRFPEQEKCQ